MLKINKVDEPEFLKEYKRKYNPQNWSDYGNDGIRDQLKEYIGNNEQVYNENYFCIYCERKVILDNKYSHIEHVMPKDKFPQEFQNYNNLTLCCNSQNSCGKIKGNKYSEKFVNPVKENPNHYFTYDEMTMEIISKEIEFEEKKKYTIDEILNLNNYSLIEARKTMLIKLEEAKKYGYLDYVLENYDQFPSFIEFYKENFM